MGFQKSVKRNDGEEGEEIRDFVNGSCSSRSSSSRRQCSNMEHTEIRVPSVALMLSVAFTSGQSMLLVHVGFLIIIASTLFILLNWFLAQTGLVPVETQMQELNLAPTDKSQ